MQSRFSGVASVTWASVILSVLLWLLAQRSVDYIFYFALRPDLVAQGRYMWTLLTHVFVHVSLLHLFFNMYVLANLGPVCERIVGRKAFIRFYVLAGVFAGGLSVLLAVCCGYAGWRPVFGAPDIFLLGGSGAIFALASFFVVVLPRARFAIIFLPFFALRGYLMVPLVLFATWAASIVWDLPIGNVAHFGGFVLGLVYGAYARVAYRGRLAWMNYAMRHR
jgi:membrane associated rhomboid family serine protease